MGALRPAGGAEPQSMDNYSSVAFNLEAVRRQFQEDEAEGLMARVPPFRSRRRSTGRI